MKYKVGEPSEKCVGYNNLSFSEFLTISPNSAFEIVIDEKCLASNISSENPKEDLKQLVDKLRYMGELVICGVEIELVTKKYLNEEINEHDLSLLLEDKKNLHNGRTIRKSMENFGLKIIEHTIKNNSFCIRGIREPN